MAKPKYKFSHYAGGAYYWHLVSPSPGIPYTVTCRKKWFWCTHPNTEAIFKRVKVNSRCISCGQLLPARE